MRFKTLRIKFMDRAAPQQQINYVEVSGCTHLELVDHGDFLEISYQNINGLQFKVLGFNKSDIKEYAFEGIFHDLS